jgi:putative pre-16S rRNA nuclease
MTSNTNNTKNTGNKASPIVTIDELASQLVIGRPLLGLDPGTKTIGMAISDSLHNIATPHETVRRSKFAADAAQILEVIKQFNAGGIILGLPLNMDGSEGPRVQSVRAFARNLGPIVKLPICFWDERLSTIAVERTLLEADASRKRRSEVIDKMAAGFILQGALDRISQIKAAAQ